jgi:hypothetical protein
LQHKNTYALVFMFIITMLAMFVVTFLFPITRLPNVSAVETVNTIGVYWDEKCENRVYSLDWGTLSPGSTRKFNLYVRNECKKCITLDLLTENWSPLIAAQNVSLSWNYHGKHIYKNQIVPAELELSVSPKIKGVTSFSFDIVIDGKISNLSLGEVIEENVLNAPADTVFFIYADPAYMGCAEATYDVTSGEAVRNLCVNSQRYGFNTTQQWLLPSGAVNTAIIHNATVATFGGRCPSVVVNYYETIKELTPVKCQLNSTHLWFEDRLNNSFGSIPLSVLAVPNYHEDLFTMMVFYDDDGDNTFFFMYGGDWKATWASGIYFQEVISKNLDAYTDDYYVFRWVDDSGQDGIPQSSEIHQETVS